MYNKTTMVILTKRKKATLACRGPMCGQGAPLSKKGRELSVARKAAVVRRVELVSAEKRRQTALDSESIVREREVASAAIAEKNKDCFIASNGEKVCNAGQGKLFNSPEKILENVNVAILEGLPKLATATTLLTTGLGLELALPILLVGAVGSGVSFGKMFGPTTVGFRKTKSKRNV